MKVYTERAELYSAYDEAKRSATRFVTNLFPEPHKIERWLKDRQLHEVVRGRAMILLRKQEDLFYVIFAVADPDALIESLKKLPTNLVCVCDLVGRPDEVEELTACFEKAGFRKYKTLQRLVRMADSVASYSHDSNVEYACVTDVPKVLNSLVTSFDRYAEQIPSHEELVLATEQKRILIIRDGAELAGFLFFEQQGQTAVVRYWFVSSESRDAGIGSKLMKTFFNRCSNARRSLLWVISTNENAIAKYDHYGYKPDFLNDQVMIKGILK